MTYRVGLTGGIGSGKSTVAGFFADLGVPIIDADVAARAVVEPGRPALAEIARVFGEELVVNGRLQRDRLRGLVFADSRRRRQLESLLHPLIRSEMNQQLRKVDSAYCILSIPLLLEVGWQDEVDSILVVDTTEAMQIARTMQRDGLTAAEVEAIMHSQVPRRARLAQADEIIRNDGDINSLRMQVRHIHDLYLQKAAARGSQTGSA
jgi:dephospho-CoA kinase